MSLMHGFHTRIMRWMLISAAFMLVISLSACSSSSEAKPAPLVPDGPVSPAVATPLDPSVLSTGVSSSTTPAANAQPVSTVNVFGELDGVERGPGHPHGQGGFQQHTFIDEGYDCDVNIDPTGKWMVFASTRLSDHPNLYMQKVDGLSVIQLTDDEADYAYPVFSPDGKQIAFCSTRSGNWEIYVMDSDGRNIVQITNGPQQHIHPTFSPDGTRLAYCALGGKSGQWELWTVDLTTAEKRMIGFGLFPCWCPAKGVDRIAFQRARQRGGRWFSLWTLDLVDGEARRITEVAVSSNAAIVSPTWSPDGKQLAFSTIAEPSDSTGSKPLGQQDIWTIDVDGSHRHRLTDGVGMNLSPCWGCDNRIYFISDRAGAECVWSVRSDDGPNTKMADKTDKPPSTDAVGSTN